MVWRPHTKIIHNSQRTRHRKPDISDTFSDSLIYEANNHLKNVFTPYNLKTSSLSNSYTSANTLSQSTRSTSNKRKIKTADRKTIYKLSDIILKKLNKSPHQNQPPHPRHGPHPRQNQPPHLHRTTQINNNSQRLYFFYVRSPKKSFKLEKNNNKKSNLAYTIFSPRNVL